MAAWKLPAELSSVIASLACVLDARNAWRLRPMLTGLLFARGRRTVTSWLRAIGVRRHYQDYYYFLASLGRKCESVAGILLLLIVRQLSLGDRLLFALDDSPTKRYGPKVEGAGIHHNPAPGPADAKFLYGHVWVTLALLLRHPCHGTIGLPLLARLYVRAKDAELLRLFYRWQFRTKLELAAGQVEWLTKWLKFAGKSLWIVTDGAYAKRPFLQRAQAAGATVVSRLRKDAALHTVPAPPKRGVRRRGRPRIYGAARIELAKRAGQTRGWQREEFTLYGKPVIKRYKTFLASYRPAGGLIRVLLVKNEDGSWVPYFCTDTSASVASMLEAVADRFAIEQVFHDVKEVQGAGQEQLRNAWANIAAWNMQLWLHTLVELWAWNQSQTALCARQDSPWDDAARRPSHADRCKALRRECLAREFTRHAAVARWTPKIRAFVRRLAQQAA